MSGLWPKGDQRSWWHSSHCQSWELLPTHMQGYLPLTNHQDSSDVFHWRFWHSHSPLPWLFAPFRRFDCPPVWDQKPRLLTAGHRSSRGLSRASHRGFAKPGCRSPAQPVCLQLPSPLSRKSQVLMLGFGNCQAHRYSKTLPQNTGTTIKSLLLVPNAPLRQHGEQHPSGKGMHMSVRKPTCRPGNNRKTATNKE